jgi:hypothetical protein
LRIDARKTRNVCVSFIYRRTESSLNCTDVDEEIVPYTVRNSLICSNLRDTWVRGRRNHSPNWTVHAHHRGYTLGAPESMSMRWSVAAHNGLTTNERANLAHRLNVVHNALDNTIIIRGRSWDDGFLPCLLVAARPDLLASLFVGFSDVTC